MRPSISVLEPGLERGVPWGRDLYTFVTSAAGHMMRTLQKPRKSRPSKRQVNHRRFLHNMIQRKFADIEAANHRLASALYFKEEEKDTSSLLSQKRDVLSQSDPLQDPEKCSVPTDADDTSKTRSNASAVSEKKQSDFGHRWKSHKSSCTTGLNNQSKESRREERRHKQEEFSLMSSSKDTDCFPELELLHSEYYHDQSQLKPVKTTENTQAPPNSSSALLFAPNENNSPSFSSALSPLSLDSCDFSVQMFSELTSCSDAQKILPEGQLTDLYSVGNSYSGGWMEVEDYFESICSCQDGARPEVCGDDDITSADLLMDDRHCEGWDYEYGHSCPEDQEATANFCQAHQSPGMLRQRQYTDEKQCDNFKPSQSADANLDLLSTSVSCSYNVTQLQTQQRIQGGSSCINMNVTPFEGVAQSFSAPHHHHHHHHMDQLTPTPPYEEDWLFTDIMKDKQFLYF